MKNFQKAILCSLASILLLANCRMVSGAREARHLAVGQRHMEKQDYARAVLEFRNAVQAAPTSPEAHYRLGTALLAVGDMRSGIQQLLKCAELNPKHAASQAKLAELMATSRDAQTLEEARKRARAAFEADPEDVAALDAMAAVEWNRDNPQQSEQYLERALRRMPGHLKTAVTLANIKLATKDNAGAEQVLRSAADNGPASPEARAALGNIYLYLKRTNEAEEQFQKALQLKADYGPALLELARLRVVSGRKDEADQYYRRVAALPDKAYRPAYALYLLYLVDANRGIAELERLYREDPQDRNIRTRLVSAYLRRDRHSEAESVLNDAVRRNPKDIAALTQRGELLTSMRRYREAEQDLLKVLQYEPSAAAHLQLSRIYSARNEPLRQRQELAEALRADPAALTVRLTLAGEHLKSGAPKTALEVLGGAPEYQRNTLQYVKVRNWALLGSGDLAGAEQGIRAALATGADPELVLQSANLRFRLKDFAGARRFLESILKDHPGDIRALEALVETYVMAGEATTGIQQLKSYASRQTASAPVQMLLAGWLRKAGDRGGARAAVTAAAAADPKAVAPVLMVAELDLLDNQLESARRTLGALPANERERPEAQMLFSSLEQQAGNYSKCMEHLRAVVAAAPQSVVALNNLAYLLVDYANRPDEGLMYAQKVKELAPENEKVEDTIGWAFFAKGLYPSAIGHLERAVARDGKAAVPRYHLAMAYVKTGDVERARQMLAQATRLDPAAPERKRAADLLASATSGR